MGKHVHHPGIYLRTRIRNRTRVHIHIRTLILTRRNGLASRREFLWSMLASGVVVPLAFGQDTRGPRRRNNFGGCRRTFEAKGLAEPFRGITTNGTVTVESV